MIEKLIQFLEERKLFILRSETYETKKAFYQQAFGAIEFAYLLAETEADYETISDLWTEKWKYDLEELVYED